MKYYRAFSLFIIIIINTFLNYYVDAVIGGNGGGGLGAAEDDGKTKMSFYGPSCLGCMDLQYQKYKPGC